MKDTASRKDWRSPARQTRGLPLTLILAVVTSVSACGDDDPLDEVCINDACASGPGCFATLDCGAEEICAEDGVDGVDGVCVSTDWCTENGCTEFEVDTCYPGCAGGQGCLDDGGPLCVDQCTGHSDCDSLCCLDVGASYKLCAPVGSALVDTHCAPETCHARDACLTGAIDFITPNTCTSPEYLYGGVFTNQCAEDIQCKWCLHRGGAAESCWTATVTAGASVSGGDFEWCGVPSDQVRSLCVLASDPTSECLDQATP